MRGLPPPPSPPAQVATDTCVVRTFDVSTMSKEDAAFEAPFSLTALRDECIHALVIGDREDHACATDLLCGMLWMMPFP
jgi:hypothetical protein